MTEQLVRTTPHIYHIYIQCTLILVLKYFIVKYPLKLFRIINAASYKNLNKTTPTLRT